MLMGDDAGLGLLVESGAFLLADNILWSGKVVAPVARNDLHTQRVLDRIQPHQGEPTTRAWRT